MRFVSWLYHHDSIMNALSDDDEYRYYYYDSYYYYYYYCRDDGDVVVVVVGKCDCDSTMLEFWWLLWYQQ